MRVINFLSSTSIVLLASKLSGAAPAPQNPVSSVIGGVTSAAGSVASSVIGIASSFAEPSAVSSALSSAEVAASSVFSEATSAAGAFPTPSGFPDIFGNFPGFPGIGGNGSAGFPFPAITGFPALPSGLPFENFGAGIPGFGNFSTELSFPNFGFPNLTGSSPFGNIGLSLPNLTTSGFAFPGNFSLPNFAAAGGENPFGALFGGNSTGFPNFGALLGNGSSPFGAFAGGIPGLGNGTQAFELPGL